MKKLTGTEKQVAWAEDIRKRYTETAETLKEIIAIYSDNTQAKSIAKEKHKSSIYQLH